MKKKILATVLTAGMLMTGCGNEPSAQDDKKTFTYGTVAYGVAMENVGTNPHESYSGWSTIRYGIGETLFKFNEHMQLESWIAEGFEQVDDFTVKIKIKDNVTFSNGKKVDGNAVKACIEHLIATHDRAPRDLKISSITADGQFVTITSAEKVPALLNYLSDPYGCIVDVEAGEHEKIVVKSITDGDTLTMAMQNGELDAVQGLPYSSLKLFNDADKFKLSQTDTSRIYQAAFNFNTPELQDVNVRRAISMAIDKENFTKVLLSGNGTPAVGPFPANLPFGDDAVNAVPFDLEGAKKLLEAAGWKDTDGDGYVDKDGKNLELNYLTYTSRQELPLLAESAQASLKKIGVKLNINATDNYKTFLKNGDYDIFSKAIVTAPTGDAKYYFTSHIVNGAVDNAGNYTNCTTLLARIIVQTLP